MSEAAGESTIRTFDEFIEAAAAHFGYDQTRSPFPSREAGISALRRWWGEHVQLEVVAPGSYRWRCTGCSNAVETERDDMHTWETFDYVIWEHCPTCHPLLHGDGQV